MTARAVVAVGLVALFGCQPMAHRYCHTGLIEADGGYHYERDGSYFYERDGGYFLERDGGYFYERDGGYFYERDGRSYPVVCRSGVRCDEQGDVACKVTASSSSPAPDDRD